MSWAATEADRRMLDSPGEAGPALQWPYRMSLALYEQIAELDVIRNEEHVILLDGILIQTGPKTPAYCYACHLAREALAGVAPDGWLVRANQPVTLRDGPLGDSVPEPEVAAIPGPSDRYWTRHPEAIEAALVVRIVATPAALAVERAGLYRYAHGRVPAVWIVALHDRTIHVCTEPSGPLAVSNYGRIEVRRTGERIEATLPPQEPGGPPTILGPIAVASFFPPAR